jgi:hypothetical protein
LVILGSKILLFIKHVRCQEWHPVCFVIRAEEQGGFMSNKLVDNKKRNHAEKVLQAMSKKASQPGSPIATPATDKKTSVVDPLRDQYEVIRKDLLKLREDLSKGYDMAREVLERKGLINELLKLR